MNRRGFIVCTATAGVGIVAPGTPWPARADAATDEELAYANFGIAAELLLEDFYIKALRIDPLTRPARSALRTGRAAAARHEAALAALLVGAGQTAPGRDDFAFVWPRKAFTSLAAATDTCLLVMRPVLGAYQTALAVVSEPSHRTLYASLGCSLGQQMGALCGPAAVEPFPVARDLEAASAAIEGFLG